MRAAAQSRLKIYFHTPNQDALWSCQREMHASLLACRGGHPGHGTRSPCWCVFVCVWVARDG